MSCRGARGPSGRGPGAGRRGKKEPAAARAAAGSVRSPERHSSGSTVSAPATFPATSGRPVRPSVPAAPSAAESVTRQWSRSSTSTALTLVPVAVQLPVVVRKVASTSSEKRTSTTVPVGSARRLTNAPSKSGSVASPEVRSEEHTSELQSQSNLVCRLLLEKKNNKRTSRQQFTALDYEV